MDTAATSRIVTPGQKRIALSNDDWLIVKHRLNAGEMLDLFERAAPGMGTAAAAPHPTRVGLAIVTAYLLDWSLVDPQGVPIPIREASIDEKAAVLRSLDFESFTEVMDAITNHDAAIRQEKKQPGAGRGSSTPSASPAPADGVTSG